MCKKESYAVSAAIVMVIVVMMFFPLTGTAGSLDPGTAPAPTMKTLDQITPAWSQKLSGAQRFELVLDGAGVLDKETGLVWEQTPSLTSATWADAIDHCYKLEVGGRSGWHLPTIEQLASLYDPSVAGNPKLPAGNPFGYMSYPFWSATDNNNTSLAWGVDFGDAVPGNDIAFGYVKIHIDGVLCVRGGSGYYGH